MEFEYSEKRQTLSLEDGRVLNISDPEAFSIISRAWVRAGWDAKYVYSFSWLGRPVIQLPEDLLRIQEVIFQLKPDFVIETGVAHGGSLVFYASLLKAIGKGKVIGVDVHIREMNRVSIENHELADMITLIEGDSIENGTIARIRDHIEKNSVVMVILDSNHTKEHVLRELEAYSEFVSQGSFMVVCDGIMASLEGAPRTSPDWSWNNPVSAIDDFLSKDDRFFIHEPVWNFNEGTTTERITYWPSGYLKRV